MRTLASRLREGQLGLVAGQGVRARAAESGVPGGGTSIAGGRACLPGQVRWRWADFWRRGARKSVAVLQETRPHTLWGFCPSGTPSARLRPEQAPEGSPVRLLQPGKADSLPEISTHVLPGNFARTRTNLDRFEDRRRKISNTAESFRSPQAAAALGCKLSIYQSAAGNVNHGDWAPRDAPPPCAPHWSLVHQSTATFPYRGWRDASCPEPSSMWDVRLMA